MLKEEFEEMIDKEVDVETFEMYELMYNALPESINKQQFVEMLNVAAIPEGKAAIERRREKKRFEDKITAKIEEKKAELKAIKEEVENIKSWLSVNSYGVDYWKNELKWDYKKMRKIKLEIAELKAILK